MTTNFILAFDGPDASGKTLITQLVSEELKMRYKPKGFSVHLHRMPGGTPAGAEIRKLLKNPEIEIAPKTERLLFAADTAEFFYHLLQQIGQGERSIHIVDRWSPITEYMYGLPRGVSAEELRYIIGAYMNNNLVVMPDMLFLVDVAWEDVMSRLHAERRPACRIEQLGDSYHRAVWSLYRDAATHPQSQARRHCESLAHRVLRLDNTNPSVRTARDVAIHALAEIERLMAEKEGK